MKLTEYILSQLEFKNWSNKIGFEALMKFDPDEIIKNRKTKFKNILGTLNHIYVVEDIFKSHLSEQSHNYIGLNTRHYPSLVELISKQSQMDEWYYNYALQLTDKTLYENIHFKFQDGKDGEMTKLQILTHIVTHDTFHKGFVNEMVYKIPSNMPNNDYPVFVRDIMNKESILM